MSATLLESGDRAALTLPRRLLIAAATAGVLTFLAPWGTQALPLPRRALSWLSMVAIWEAAIFLLGRGAVAWRRRRGAARPHCLPLPWLLALVIGASLPAVPLCMLALFGRLPPASIWATFYANAIGLGAIIALIRSRLPRGDMQRSDPVAAPVSEPAAGDTAERAFLARHAPHLGHGSLLALQAEDHYLRIHTDRGDALVLLRLRDAVAALGDAAGVQVHRSFWVARDAAPTASRRGQAWQLDLAGGLSVKVSRANVPACRAAGWL